MSRRAIYTPVVVLQLLGLFGGTAAAVSTATTHDPSTRNLPLLLVDPTPSPFLQQARALRQGEAKPRPRPARASARPVPARPRRQAAAVAPTTPQQRLARAVTRIPGYQPGEARWVVTGRFGNWGVADLEHATIYISPDVPARRLYDVAAHEWSHVLSVKAYHGDVDRAVAAMNSTFGGTGLTGVERAADCMARLLGARWTHYTSCTDPEWRAGARRLLARKPL